MQQSEGKPHTLTLLKSEADRNGRIIRTLFAILPLAGAAPLMSFNFAPGKGDSHGDATGRPSLIRRSTTFASPIAHHGLR